VTFGEVCLFAFTLDQTQGSRWQAAAFLAGLIAPAPLIYFLKARSRIGSIVTGTAIAAGVLAAFLLAPGTGEHNGLEFLWIPFIAWLIAFVGLVMEGVFHRWDREREW